ncbi:MAG: hypothetical protein NTU53_16640 [Planctomycetota bacterium]|nr:hypothetical protein [Planctomycetota bacterium]
MPRAAKGSPTEGEDSQFTAIARSLAWLGLAWHYQGGIAATYVPDEKRLGLTWSRNKNEEKLSHQVRYAFQSIHAIGWDKAMPAPGGIITPPGVGGYNGMVYTTTDVPLDGKKTVFLGIRPEDASRFSQTELPILGR